MKLVLKSIGYLFMLLLLLVVLVLLCLRFRPDWFVGAVNQVQSAAEVQAEGLGVTFLPLSLTADRVQLGMEAQDVTVDQALASANLSAWWTDEPFWQVEVDKVHVDQHPVESSSSEPGSSGVFDVMPYLTFNKLRLGTLTVAGATPLEAKLTAEQKGQQIELLASAQVAGNRVELNGTLTRSSDDLGFELALASTPEQGEELKAAAELRGNFASASKMTLDVDSGWIEVVTAEQTHRVDNLAGLVSLVSSAGADQIILNGLGGEYLGPNWSEALKVAATGTVSQPPGGLDIIMALTAGETTVEVSTDDGSDAFWQGDLRIASQGLPSSVSIDPYQAADLFPLKLSSAVRYDGGEVTLTGLQLETPSNVLAGAVTVKPGEPLKLIADLDAKRLYVPLMSATEPAAEETEEAPDSKTAETPEDTTSEPAVAAAESDDEAAPEEVVFSEQPIDWSWLETAEIDVSLNAESLRLQEAEFTALRVKALNDASRLTIEPFSATLGKGGFKGAVNLGLSGASNGGDASDQRPVDATLSLTVDGVALESFGFVPQEELQGGALEVDLDLHTAGNSAHALAEGLGGDILVLVEEAVLMNDFIELAGSDLVMETLSKLNPFAKEDPTTELECALVLFKAEDGVLTTKNQLVMETTKMEIIGNGNLNLGEETIDITFAPNAKSGVGINVGSLVKFLKLGGTLANPSPAADAGGLLKSGLAIGAAISTGGASVLVEGLAKRAINAGSACVKARQGTSTEAPAASE